MEDFEKTYTIKYKDKTLAGVMNQINDEKDDLIHTWSSTKLKGLLESVINKVDIELENIQQQFKSFKGVSMPIGIMSTISTDEIEEQLNNFVSEKKGRESKLGDEVAVYLTNESTGDEQFYATYKKNDSEWVQWNKSNILQEATDTSTGVVQMATSEEAKDKEVKDKVITPETLNDVMEDTIYQEEDF